MPYSPPEFTTLMQATDELETNFSALAKRYQSQSLENLLEAVKIEIFASTTYRPRSEHRRQQVAVFRLLYNELIEIARQSDEAKKVEALNFMLGALIHRYFRLIFEYTQRPDSMVLSMFGSNIEQCGLYQSIKKVLQLSPENDPLDPLTIVSCCQSFYENMQADNRYLNYPHFKKDVDFFYNLQHIISKNTPEAKPALAQVEAISFLTSVAQELNAIHSKSIDALEELFSHLERVEPLDVDKMISSLPDCIKDKGIRLRIEQLLRTPYIVKSIESEDRGLLKQNIIRCLEARSQYALFGAYIVVLDRSEAMDELKQAIKLTLCGAAISNTQIDSKTRLNGLMILQAWVLDIEEEYSFDCTTWGGNEARLKARVIEQKAALMDVLDKEAGQDQSVLRAVS